MNGYDLSKVWFDFAFDHPEKISPNHAAIYFFAIEHCNRLGWKSKFGFPTQMAMDAIGIKKHSTYIRYFNDLVEWGFFKLIQKSRNQYSANIISLTNAKPKNGKALGKAIAKHGVKHTAKHTAKQKEYNKTEEPNNIKTIEPTTTEDQKLEDLKNSNWFEVTCMTTEIKHDQLQYVLDNYQNHLITQGETFPMSDKELKRHLASLARKWKELSKLPMPELQIDSADYNYDYEQPESKYFEYSNGQMMLGINGKPIPKDKPHLLNDLQKAALNH
jgi:hypothetical protein